VEPLRCAHPAASATHRHTLRARTTSKGPLDDVVREARLLTETPGRAEAGWLWRRGARSWL